MQVAGYTFRSNFCSGNVATVEDDGVRSDGTQAFEITLKPDCAGLECVVTDARTWFHFGVVRAAGSTAAKAAQFRIMNFNDHSKMYSQGMRVVTRTVRGGAHRVACPPHEFTDGTPWGRCPLAAECEKNPDAKSLATLTWEHSFEAVDADTETFFAFCYPHSFEQCQSWLSNIVSTYGGSDEAAAGAEAETETGATGPVAAAVDGSSAAAAPDAPYVCRETLATSLEGRPIEMLTISSREGMSAECDAGVAEGKARRFPGKPIIFVSARVHPGETPGSFILMGLVELALRQKWSAAEAKRGGGDAPTRQAMALAAAAFRKHFVLKVVPMLNPDGVSRGHYRNNVRGENLNRCYADPDPAIHPAVAAVRRTVETWVEHGEQVALYIDLHAHSKKRGCFVYGNHLSDVRDQIENVMYAKLVSLSTPHFDFGGSVFSASNMDRADRKKQSKAGSGRVGLFRATGLIRCYTLEANYNCGRLANALGVGVAPEPSQCSGGVDVPIVARSSEGDDAGCAVSPLPPGAAAKKGKRKKKGKRSSSSRGKVEDGQLALPSSPAFQNPPYGPSEWEACGHGLLLGLLELYCLSPISRLPRSTFNDVAGLRAKMTAIVTRSKGYRAKRPPRQKVVLKPRVTMPANRRAPSQLNLVLSLGGAEAEAVARDLDALAAAAAAGRRPRAGPRRSLAARNVQQLRLPAGSGAKAVLRQRVLAEVMMEEEMAMLGSVAYKDPRQ